MRKPDLLALAEEERADLLALLGDLTTEQWETRSLCSKWRVRDVATHVVSYEELSAAALVGTFLRGGLRVNKVNDVALNRYRSLENDAVVDLLARNLLPLGLTSGFGGAIALTDGTIHHQDIRRALDLPRTIPETRLRPVLDFALRAPTLTAKRNSNGLTLTATDIKWTAGDGPEVIGTGEALLMAVTGRPQALDELGGPGIDTLRQRVS